MKQIGSHRNHQPGGNPDPCPPPSFPSSSSPEAANRIMVNDATRPFLCPGSVWGSIQKPRNPGRSEESWGLDALCSRIVGQTGPALFPRPNDGDLIILIIDQGPAWANMTRLTKYWPNIDHIEGRNEGIGANSGRDLSLDLRHALARYDMSPRYFSQELHDSIRGSDLPWTLLRLRSSSQPQHQAWP